MEYLKLFEEKSEYQTYVDNGEIIRPNISSSFKGDFELLLTI